MMGKSKIRKIRGQSMKTKIVCATVATCVLLAVSCASTNVMSVNATMQPAVLDIGSLSRDQYIIIGQVSGEGYITAKTSIIKNQAKTKAVLEPTYFSTDVIGDSGRYGFLGSEVNTNMTILDKAIAIATYKMIQAAQYNGADTVVYVTTTTKILPKSYSSFSSGSIVSAKVTGLAIKIKPDAGIKIKIPDPEESVIKQVEQEKAAEKAAKKTKAEVKKVEQPKDAVEDSAATTKANTDEAAEATENGADAEEAAPASVQTGTTPANTDTTKPASNAQ